MGPVAGQQVQLLEAVRVEQVLDALAGQHLALGVLTLDRPRGAGRVRLVLALAQLLQAVLHRVGHGGRRYFARDAPVR